MQLVCHTCTCSRNCTQQAELSCPLCHNAIVFSDHRYNINLIHFTS